VGNSVETVEGATKNAEHPEVAFSASDKYRQFDTRAKTGKTSVFVHGTASRSDDVYVVLSWSQPKEKLNGKNSLNNLQLTTISDTPNV
jgi:hypothetical protein